MIRSALSFAFAVAAVSCPEQVQAAEPLRETPVAKQHPGYGVVQSVTPLPPREESASAGGSSSSASSGASRRPGYLIRVKLDDGSIQVRSIRKPAFAPGERVFITNAGDVVPE